MKKINALNIIPEQRRTLVDIVQFSFAAKADLRDTHPFGLFAVVRI